MVMVAELLMILCVLFLQGVSISTLVEPGQSEPLCLVPTSKDNTLHVKVGAVWHMHWVEHAYSMYSRRSAAQPAYSMYSIIYT